VELRAPVPGERRTLSALLRGTGRFRDSEVAVALELFDLGAGDPPADPSYRWLGAYRDGELAGAACFGPIPASDGTFDLYWIAVDASRQGQGIGSRLLDEVERRVRAHGGRLLVIETSSRDDYEGTRTFYMRRGYAEGARLRAFYAPDDDRVILTRRLAALANPVALP